MSSTDKTIEKAGSVMKQTRSADTPGKAGCINTTKVISTTCWPHNETLVSQ
jgi:hypothetical protein